jgi:hypothetical protein
VPITYLQHHNKHEYNIDSLWNSNCVVATLDHLRSTTQAIKIQCWESMIITYIQ